MKKSVDVIYVVASKLGSIGMGQTSYNAVKSLDASNELSYRIFCRGYDSTLKLNKKNVRSYGFLEYLSLPLRFLQKNFGINFNPFVWINNWYGKLIKRHVLSCKIYHTWVWIAPEALLKAKKQGAITILEGANSHPLKMCEILNEEFSNMGREDLLIKKKDLEQEVKPICNSIPEYIALFDYVMCPSDFVYDSFLEYGVPKEKLIRNPYGVDLQRFTSHAKKNQTFKAVFVGSLQVRKGIHYLLQAWDELKLKHAELVIVGRVWPDFSEIYERYKDHPSITFVGFSKNPSQYLNNADVFISPSLEEGSALTCYEAMAAGLPLIATYNTGSVARNNKEGFIIPIRDISVLKEKIQYFYDHPDKRREMGVNARKRVESYSWDAYGRRTLEIYKSLIQNTKKRQKYSSQQRKTV